MTTESTKHFLYPSKHLKKLRKSRILNPKAPTTTTTYLTINKRFLHIQLVKPSPQDACHTCMGERETQNFPSPSHPTEKD
jgi:hypothetical protein